MSVLELTGVSYAYPGEPDALRDVSLTVEPGEFVVVSGGSGSGKSTLLRAACGLVPHFHGGVFAGRLRCAGLEERDLHRVRLERDELGPVDLDDWSGIVVGGGPWNVSDPADSKAAEQLRGEARLADLARQVVAADFPFLGACYGVGTLGLLDGGIVDRSHPEPIGPVAT